MNTSVLITVITTIGTLAGTLFGMVTTSRLTEYRIKALENKCQLLMQVSEKIVVLETELEELKRRSNLHEKALNRLRGSDCKQE